MLTLALLQIWHYLCALKLNKICSLIFICRISSQRNSQQIRQHVSSLTLVLVAVVIVASERIQVLMSG